MGQVLSVPMVIAGVWLVVRALRTAAGPHTEAGGRPAETG
jgi:prolipoprotein diacylglyceryltransferase